MNEDINNELDQDLDDMFAEGDDMSMDDDPFAEAGPREPIDQAKAFAATAVERATSKEGLIENASAIINKTMPKPLADQVQIAKEINEEVLEPVSIAFKNARKSTGSLVSAVSGMLPEIPGVTSSLRKIADAITPDEEDDSSEEGSIEEDENERISSMVSETFEERNRQDEEEKRLETVKSLTETEMSIKQLSSLIAIKDFFHKDFYAYIKKDLELKYKQTFALVDIRNEIKENGKATQDLLQAVVKNTSLPDMVKMKNKEYLEHISKQKMFEAGLNLIKNNPITDKLKEGFWELTKNKLESVSAFSDDMKNNLGMMSMMDDMPAEMKQEMLAQTAVDTAMQFVGGKVMKAGNKLPFMAKLTRKAKSIMSSPDKLLDMLPGKVKNNEFVESLQGVLKDAFHEKDKIQGTSLATENIYDPAVFDEMTKKSINTTIPGLLSKILNEVKAIRTGSRKVDENKELIYDYKSNKFVETAKLRKNLELELKENKERFDKNVESTSDSIVDILLGKHNDKETKLFKNSIAKLILAGESVNPFVWVEEPKTLKTFDKKIRNKVIENLNKLMTADDMESIEKLLKVEKSLKSIKEDMRFASASIDNLKQFGKTDMLNDYDLLADDGSSIGREQLINFYKGKNKKLANKKETTEQDTTSDNVTSNNVIDTVEVDNTELIDVISHLVTDKLIPVLDKQTAILKTTKDLIKDLKIEISDNTIDTFVNKLLSGLRNIVETNRTRIESPQPRLLTNGIDKLQRQIKKISLPKITSPKTTKETIDKQPIEKTENIYKGEIKLNKAIVNIGKAVIKGLDKSIENVLGSFSQGFNKISSEFFNKDFKDNLIGSLNTSFDKATSNLDKFTGKLLNTSIDDIKNIDLNPAKKYIESKYTTAKDKFNQTETGKALNSKVTSLKQTDTYKNLEQGFIDKKKSLTTNFNTFKGNFKKDKIIEKLENHFGDNFVKIEEVNDKGEKETSYLLDVAGTVITIPTAVLASPALLTGLLASKLSPETLSSIKLPSSTKDLVDLKNAAVTNITNTATDVKKSLPTFKDIKDNGIVEAIKQSDAGKYVTKQTENIKVPDVIKNNVVVKGITDTASTAMTNVQTLAMDNISIDKLLEHLPEEAKTKFIKTEHGYAIKNEETNDWDDVTEEEFKAKLIDYLKTYYSKKLAPKEIKEKFSVAMNKADNLSGGLLTKGELLGKSALGVGLYATGALGSNAGSIASKGFSAISEKIKGVKEVIDKRKNIEVEITRDKLVEDAIEFFKNKTPEDIYKLLAEELEEYPIGKTDEEEIKILRKVIFGLDPTGLLWQMLTDNKEENIKGLMDFHSSILAEDFKGLNADEQEQTILTTLGAQRVLKNADNIMASKKFVMGNDKAKFLSIDKLKEYSKKAGEGEDLFNLPDKIQDNFKEMLNAAMKENGQDGSLGKELLKQMFGKDISKSKLSIFDILKAGTTGYFKGSFWFGRNVLRPAYKKAFAGLGAVTKTATKFVLTDVLGVNPKVADGIIKVMEFPFKMADKMGKAISKSMEKARDALKGVWNFMKGLASKFMGGTWKLIKKGLSFITGKSEEDIDKGAKNTIKKVKSTYNKAKEKSKIVKGLDSVTRFAGRTIGGTAKAAKAVAGFPFKALVINDEDLWLNKKMKAAGEKIQDTVDTTKAVAKESQKLSLRGIVNNANVSKSIDADGRDVATVSGDGVKKNNGFVFNPLNFYKGMRPRVGLRKNIEKINTFIEENKNKLPEEELEKLNSQKAEMLQELEEERSKGLKTTNFKIPTMTNIKDTVSKLKIPKIKNPFSKTETIKNEDGSITVSKKEDSLFTKSTKKFKKLSTLKETLTNEIVNDIIKESKEAIETKPKKKQSLLSKLKNKVLKTKENNAKELVKESTPVTTKKRSSLLGFAVKKAIPGAIKGSWSFGKKVVKPSYSSAGHVVTGKLGRGLAIAGSILTGRPIPKKEDKETKPSLWERIKDRTSKTKASIDARQKKIEEMRDALEKDNESTAMKEEKSSDSGISSIFGILGTIASVLGFIKKGIFKIVPLIGKIGKSIFGLGKTIVSGFMKTGKWLLGGLGKLFTSKTFVSLFTKGKDMVKSTASSLWNGAKHLLGFDSKPKEAIKKLPTPEVKKTPITTPKPKSTSFFGSLWNKAKNFTKGAVGKIKEVGGKAWDGVKKAGGYVVDKTKALAKKLLGPLTKKVTGLVKTLASKFPGLVKILPKLGPGLKAVASKIPIASLFTGAAAVGYDLMKGNWKLALSDLISTILAQIPGIGTALSLAVGVGGSMAFAKDGEDKDDDKNKDENGNKIIKDLEQGSDSPVNKTYKPVNISGLYKDTNAVKNIPTGNKQNYTPSLDGNKTKPSIKLPKVKGIHDVLKNIKAPIANKKALVSDLIRHEGLKLHTYRDSLGLKTIGVGHLTDPRKGGIPLRKILGQDTDHITPTQAVQILTYDVNRTTKKLYSKAPWIAQQPDEVQKNLIDMAFNMGTHGLLSFKHTLGLIKQGRFRDAGYNLTHSKWFRQVGRRSREIVNDFISLGNVGKDGAKKLHEKELNGQGSMPTPQVPDKKPTQELDITKLTKPTPKHHKDIKPVKKASINIHPEAKTQQIKKNNEIMKTQISSNKVMSASRPTVVSPNVHIPVDKHGHKILNVTAQAAEKQVSIQEQINEKLNDLLDIISHNEKRKKDLEHRRKNSKPVKNSTKQHIPVEAPAPVVHASSHSL